MEGNIFELSVSEITEDIETEITLINGEETLLTFSVKVYYLENPMPVFRVCLDSEWIVPNSGKIIRVGDVQANYGDSGWWFLENLDNLIPGAEITCDGISLGQWGLEEYTDGSEYQEVTIDNYTTDSSSIFSSKYLFSTNLDTDTADCILNYYYNIKHFSFGCAEYTDADGYEWGDSIDFLLGASTTSVTKGTVYTEDDLKEARKNNFHVVSSYLDSIGANLYVGYKLVADGKIDYPKDLISRTELYNEGGVIKDTLKIENMTGFEYDSITSITAEKFTIDSWDQESIVFSGTITASTEDTLKIVCKRGEMTINLTYTITSNL